MSSASGTRESHEVLPPEIYLPLVDSLYQEGRSVFLGTILVTASVFLTYWKTGDDFLVYCALAIVVVGCLRWLTMRAYFRARASVTTTEAARRWEHRYVIGAAASVALLGIWCYLAFTRSRDSYADLVSFTMTMIYAGGIFGRNFGN